MLAPFRSMSLRLNPELQSCHTGRALAPFRSVCLRLAPTDGATVAPAPEALHYMSSTGPEPEYCRPRLQQAFGAQGAGGRPCCGALLQLVAAAGAHRQGRHRART